MRCVFRTNFLVQFSGNIRVPVEYRMYTGFKVEVLQGIEPEFPNRQTYIQGLYLSSPMKYGRTRKCVCVWTCTENDLFAHKQIKTLCSLLY